MAATKATPVVVKAPPEPEATKAELLTVEGHPEKGRIERWRMSDGTVKEFTFDLVWAEQA